MASAPRFAIINTTDRPERRLVAEYVPACGYCYMMRGTDKQLRTFDGMEPPAPTSMEDFGFAVRVHEGEATFVRTAPSEALYEDGQARNWQGLEALGESFTLPLVNLQRNPARRGQDSKA